MPTARPDAAVGAGDGGGLALALLDDLSLPGTFEGCDVGHALDGDAVGVDDVEPDFLARALRSEHQLVNADHAHNEPPTAVTAKIAAKRFTSNTPNICFLQFLLRLSIGASYKLQLAGAFVLHPDGDQSSLADFNHALCYHTTG